MSALLRIGNAVKELNEVKKCVRELVGISDEVMVRKGWIVSTFYHISIVFIICFFFALYFTVRPLSVNGRLTLVQRRRKC